ncbi:MULTISPECIES: ATP phosphoribosyltransferase [unclassified Thioalkalivibrio]|uniref:ATP phosphoribosyltransferase n=1 Tax=unclassified Thioalkalivibrio TaxID=2621013 RepID=UPI000195A7BD|nr:MULTISPECIES: ATP phosphoribosyltransferase [unclassified Thioalkalivibrio]ADC70895.1 ATP phosphoribosyltransferase [Thioalkalivibrio sp. K90mix]
MMDPNALTIALSKGRILKDTLPLLASAGIELLEDPDKTRKLILDTNREDVKIVVVRATDVPTYVQHGAAAIGVAGKDVLMEHGAAGLYEPLDLRIAACRLMLAGRPGQQPDPQQRLRIATKFVNITQNYFAQQGRQVEIIKLYGSMELAPLVDLADYIVDLVDTGNTLKANGLEPLELITPISSRLIVNQAAMKMRHRTIQNLIEGLREAVTPATT